MPLDNCSNCGKVFAKSNRDICPACWEAEQVLVDKIADYLHRRPSSTADDVLAELGVSQPDLVRILRRGRLKGYEQLASLLLCERCGAPADRGTFCANCRSVVLQLTEQPEEPVEEDFMAHRARQRPPAPRPHSPSVEPQQGTQDLSGRPRQDVWRDRER